MPGSAKPQFSWAGYRNYLKIGSWSDIRWYLPKRKIVWNNFLRLEVHPQFRKSDYLPATKARFNLINRWIPIWKISGFCLSCKTQYVWRMLVLFFKNNKASLRQKIFGLELIKPKHLYLVKSTNRQYLSLVAKKEKKWEQMWKTFWFDINVLKYSGNPPVWYQIFANVELFKY